MKKVYEGQKAIPSPVDWWHHIVEDLNKIGIHTIDEHIKKNQVDYLKIT